MSKRLRQIAFVFLKLGVLGFGGPAAHISMMDEEVVERRGWLDRQQFLDLVGATNLIPGPNSTEMAIHVGYLHAGLAGLAVAGAAFILPAVLITGAFAWIYVRYGSVPEFVPLLAGIKPAVVAIIFVALWRLGRKAVKSAGLAVVGAGVALAAYLGVNEVLAMLAGGLVGMLALRVPTSGSPAATPLFTPVSWTAATSTGPLAVAATGVAAATAVSLYQLGVFFLTVGSVLYGSGYVLIAFLEGGLVERYGWLTQQQLIDAVAIGQFTPGPILSTATVVGYVVAGWPGAMVATVGIFLPSFVLVTILKPLVARLRDSPWTAAFLDAINVSAVGLMAVVTGKLALASLVAWPALLIFLVAALASLRYRVGPGWLVAGAALAGWLTLGGAW